MSITWRSRSAAGGGRADMARVAATALPAALASVVMAAKLS
jgi:hypothetical protein